MADLRVNVAGVEFSNPLIAASGTFGFGHEYNEFYPLSALGGISCKGITIKERGPGEYKISMRSVDRVNVSELCKLFGGGGHLRAAGCTISGSLDEVKTLLLGAVGRALEETA